ncbi:MAG TPA: TIGR04282 family arsenosugar biosynthesis glycosyltransferase [Alphaproteobacteria bacterium]|nr:TIGR04282 family arsenosugar biosynthesis glycosyltransferase [Alphaproteobacteria bacterium]
MSPQRNLVIFAKSPALGQVKRRLAADIGEVEALRLYRANLKRLIARFTRDRRWTTRLALSPDRAANGGFPGMEGRVVVPQGGGDLGARMGRAIAGCPPGPALLIGADIPGVMPGHIAGAFEALRGHDAVFGPAVDGGYWLVGASAAGRRKLAFAAGIRWSTAYALADTRAGLPPGTNVALADILDDVDDAAAYTRWRARGAYPS